MKSSKSAYPDTLNECHKLIKKLNSDLDRYKNCLDALSLMRTKVMKPHWDKLEAKYRKLHNSTNSELSQISLSDEVNNAVIEINSIWNAYNDRALVILNEYPQVVANA